MTKIKHKTKGKINEIDIVIGKRLFEIRTAKQKTQNAVGESIKVTFQQIQKYEAGKNRISAGNLYLLAKFLEVPVTDFFPKD